MDDLQQAKQRLAAGGLTCVLCREDEEIAFTARGVRPLVMLYDSGRDVAGFSAADKVVGRGAAFMYLLLGVPRLYAGVISRPALALLEQHAVSVEYGTVVDSIRNRRGDGMCPFEQAVLDVTDAQQAHRIIVQKLAAMATEEMK